MGIRQVWVVAAVLVLQGCAAQRTHLRCDFEDRQTSAWAPGRAYADGKEVGAPPSIRISPLSKEEGPAGGAALLLDDPVGDSPEVCATVHFPKVTITPSTMVSFRYRWESESGTAVVNVRVPTGGTLKYGNLPASRPGAWQTATLKIADFTRGDVPASVGDTFDAFTVRLFGTEKGWRRLWLDDVVLYEGPDTEPPSPVAGVKAAQEGARIELSWRRPDDDTAVVSYVVHRGNTADFEPNAATEIGVTDRPRFRDVAGREGPVFYRIVARDYASNRSLPSVAVSLVPKLSALCTPELVDPPNDHSVLLGDEVVLRWKAVQGAVRYLVQYWPNSRLAEVRTEETPDATLSLKGLAAGSWRWSVAAVSADGLSGRFSSDRQVLVKRYYDTVSPGPHPRLFFEAADIPRLRAAIETDPGKALWRAIQRNADAWLEQPPVQYVPAERWGTFLITTRNANNRIEALTLVYVLTGDARYLAKAKEQVKVVLSWDCWVDPCHGGANSRADLATGEICRGLGLFYDWAYSALSQSERDEIRREMVQRGIIPIYERSLEGAFWARHYSNWCAVVHGGGGVAALAVLGEEPEASAWLDRIEAKMRCFLDAMDSEGGWVEGTCYWDYGVSYALWFTDALKRVTRGGRDLYRHERLAKTLNFVLYCTMPDAKGTVNFSDSPYANTFDSFLVRRLAAEYQNRFASWHLTRVPTGNLWDLLWQGGTPAPEAPTNDALPPAKLFPTIHWAVLRQGCASPDDCLFAIKGGTNDDWHGHRDMAGFLLNAFGKRLLIDQGMGMYRKEYWKGQDYEVTSEGHNTLLLDGKGQERRAEDCAQITRFFHSDACGYVLCDTSKAYGARLTRFLRHVVYLRPDTFVVFDDIAAPAPTRIESQLHTSGSIARNDGLIRLENYPALLLTRVLRPDGLSFTLGTGKNEQHDQADRFIRFGPPSPVREAQFLVAMRPVLLRKLPPGVAVWEDFESGRITGWTPGRAHGGGQEIGAMPEIKAAAGPGEPTHEGSRFALLLDDPVGDSPEACVSLAIPPVRLTPKTRLSLAYRWEAESGRGKVNVRINAGGVLKYFTPPDAPPGKWTKLSMKALEFRRDNLPALPGEEFSTVTVRIYDTGKGRRRLWVDNLAVYESDGADFIPPPPLVVDPDRVLSAEAVGGGESVGLRLRREGTPGEDYVLFRRQGEIRAEGIRTDAEVCALGIENGKRLARCFAEHVSNLRWGEQAILSASRQASVSCEFLPRQVRAVVEADDSASLEVFVGAKLRRVTVNGRETTADYDPAKRVCRFALDKGRSRIEAEMAD